MTLQFVPPARLAPLPTADPALKSAAQRARACDSVTDHVVTRFPLCPRQYLTDCTEATMDIAKLQNVGLLFCFMRFSYCDLGGSKFLCRFCPSTMDTLTRRR
jgi:hypothetical protein